MLRGDVHHGHSRSTRVFLGKLHALTRGCFPQVAWCKTLHPSDTRINWPYGNEAPKMQASARAPVIRLMGVIVAGQLSSHTAQGHDPCLLAR